MPPQSPHRYTGPESPRTATSPRHMQPPMQQQQQSPTTSPVAQAGSVPSPSRNPKSPQSARAKNFPLSLASITTPYNTTTTTTTTNTSTSAATESQSKNYQRRRTLGERLRLVTPHEDPVVRCSAAQRWRRPRRARKNLWLGAGHASDPSMSLQGQSRRYSDASSLMMESGRDAEEEREWMGHNLRDR
jgi:hypothetical protein